MAREGDGGSGDPGIGRHALPLNRVFIGLGSNIEAEANLPAAVRLLGKYGRIAKVSGEAQAVSISAAVREPRSTITRTLRLRRGRTARWEREVVIHALRLNGTRAGYA